MKAVLITFDQAHYSDIIELLTNLNIRGFTSWKDVFGRGSVDGIPHYGSHAYPSRNNAIVTVVEENIVPKLLESLSKLNSEYTNLGLRAFTWNIEQMI